MSDLAELIKRVEGLDRPSNELDVLIEVALFKPDGRHVAARANAAGTKVVYSRGEGGSDTHWAPDYTLAHRRADTVALLRSMEEDRG